MSDDDSSGNFGRPAYTLTDAERTYLQTGDTGSYRESVLDEKIEEKTKRLGQRINNLLRDVELLRPDQRDAWRDPWLDFLGRDPPSPAPEYSRRGEVTDITAKEASDDALWRAYTYGRREDHWRETSAASEVGGDLARLAHQLTIYPWQEGDEVKPELKDDIHVELVWGFIRTLLVDTRIAGTAMREGREERMDALMSELVERHEAGYERDRDFFDEREQRKKRTRKWGKVESEMQNRIEEILHEEGILTCNLGGDTTDNPRAIMVDRVLGLIFSELVDSEYGPISAGLRDDFRAEYGPVEEVDIGDIVTRERVLDAVEQNRLLLEGELKAIYREDRDFLEDTIVRDLDPVAVLEEVHEQPAPSSVEIASTLDTRKALVTEACNKLSGETEFASPGWSGEHVVTGSPSGWELTPYGHLLVPGLIGVKSTTDRSRPELLDEAAAQLDIEEHAFTR